MYFINYVQTQLVSISGGIPHPILGDLVSIRKKKAQLIVDITVKERPLIWFIPGCCNAHNT